MATSVINQKRNAFQLIIKIKSVNIDNSFFHSPYKKAKAGFCPPAPAESSGDVATQYRVFLRILRIQSPIVKYKLLH